MSDRNYLLLYVDDPGRSALFYRDLLALSPVELSSTFALFALKSGLMLGLWSRHTVEPAASMTGGGGELGFPVATPALVDQTHDRWTAQGLTILQPPCDLDFGRTFVAVDPDGHRLRVFSPRAP